MATKLDDMTNCPQCNADWNGGDIFETLRAQDWCKDKSDDELRAYIQNAYAPPYRFSRLVGIECRGGYDGVSFWECPDCKTRWDRFTRKEVTLDASASGGGEVEQSVVE